MAIEFGAYALIALFVLFIIERIYRKVLDNERQIEMQRNKFRVLEERLRKQAKFIKQHTKEKINANPIEISESDMMRCENCNRFYASILKNCPYCGN